MDKESYDDEPVYYCKRCLSLNICQMPMVESMCYCGDCGTTEIAETSFEEWNKMFVIVNSKAALEGSENSGASVPIVIWNGYWTREQVAQQQDKVFLFGDNANDRVSTHYIPSSTQAVIRGLPNAIGIDTKKNRGVSTDSYFTDADFDQFKAQVDSAIAQAKATGRTIVIPADGIGTGKAMLKEKAPKCFEYLQNELQKLQNPTINPEESRLLDEEKNEIEQIVTVAPYFRSHLTSENKKQLEKNTEKAKEDAQKLASAMGLQIEALEVVGGTYQGNSEIAYQYRMKSSNQELIDLFAALMGDLSIEYQDAVIAANYTKDKSQITAYELTWKAPEGTTIEKIEVLLKSLGIEGSTYHFNNGELDIIAFSEEETKEIINKLKDTDYEFKEYNGQNSRYLDNEYRRNAYRSWLNSERGKQNRQLNNACQKAVKPMLFVSKFKV